MVLIAAGAIATMSHHATAIVGVLDSRGNHIDPQAAIADNGAAIVATRIAEPGEPSRALSVSTRPQSLARWNAPVRMLAARAERHLVAVNSDGERLVAWQSPGEIWVARPRRSGSGWQRFTLDSGPGVGTLLSVGVSDRGVAQVVWSTNTGVESAYAAVSATRFSRSPSLALGTRAIVSGRGVSHAGERSAVAWSDPDTSAIGVAVRRTPRGGWQTHILSTSSTGEPTAKINATGYAGVAWSSPDATVHLARHVPGEAWTVTAAGGGAADPPRLQINPRGALLAQWTPPSPGSIGGAFHPSHRPGWIPTGASLGIGFLGDRHVDWIDPAAEALRDGRPPGTESSAMEIVHVDGRGDVFATLSNSQEGSLSLLARPRSLRSRWRVRAVSAIGLDRPRVVANRRGDVVTTFLAPSEFVPGALNPAIAAVSSTFVVKGVLRAQRNEPVVLIANPPDSGRLRVEFGAGIKDRLLNVARRPQRITVRAPRTAGTYRVQFTLRGSAGRTYSARHILRVR